MWTDYDYDMGTLLGVTSYEQLPIIPDNNQERHFYKTILEPILRSQR